MAELTFRLNEKLYLRDPQNTQLGRNIIHKGIELIDRLGFEEFTFKKLAIEINSTEASIYRYFENKHRLLHYLVAWYWSWLNFRIELATAAFHDPREKLISAIRVITEEKKYDPSFEFVDEVALNRIVVNELDKTFLTKWVDDDNASGLFGGFKALTKRLAGLISEMAPQYPFPNSLISTILLTANQQLFFHQHLPSLSNLNYPASQELHSKLREFVESLVFGAIERK